MDQSALPPKNGTTGGEVRLLLGRPNEIPLSAWDREWGRGGGSEWSTEERIGEKGAGFGRRGTRSGNRQDPPVRTTGGAPGTRHPIPKRKKTQKCQGCARSKLSGNRPTAQPTQQHRQVAVHLACGEMGRELRRGFLRIAGYSTLRAISRWRFRRMAELRRVSGMFLLVVSVFRSFAWICGNRCSETSTGVLGLVIRLRVMV
jgi:hypothetical protein